MTKIPLQSRKAEARRTARYVEICFKLRKTLPRNSEAIILPYKLFPPAYLEAVIKSRMRGIMIPPEPEESEEIILKEKEVIQWREK